MQVRIASLLAVLTVSFALVGCGGTGGPAQPSGGGTENQMAVRTDPASIRANIDKLSPEDRKLALEQRYCAVETNHELGSMDMPYKVMIKDQPVFLCCDGCETKARAHADRTLAKVQQLKEKHGQTPQK